LKEFRILQNCSICGEGFDSEYKLMKHLSKSHPQPIKAGWMGGEEDSCSCGSDHTQHKDG
jgi:C2H2-type zinc finger protein